MTSRSNVHPLRGRGSNQHRDKPPTAPREATPATPVELRTADDPFSDSPGSDPTMSVEMTQARRAADAAAHAAGVDPSQVVASVEVDQHGRRTAVLRFALPDETAAPAGGKTVRPAPESMGGLWSQVTHDPEARTMTIDTPEGIAVTYGDVDEESYNGFMQRIEHAHGRSAVTRVAEPFMAARRVISIDADKDHLTVAGGSSAIDGLAWQRQAKSLVVKWNQEGSAGPETAYWYRNVTEEQFGRLVTAPSRGRAVSRFLKSQTGGSTKGYRQADGTWDWSNKR